MFHHLVFKLTQQLTWGFGRRRCSRGVLSTRLTTLNGAALAPVVAADFHPSLATVGVLLAVFGYAVGTVAAIGCTILMQLVSP